MPHSDQVIDLLCSVPLREFLQEEAALDEKGRISRAQKAFGAMASFALEQLHVQRKAVNKVPGLHRCGWLFTQRSLEQCTSEAVAQWKAAWLRGSSFKDFTTGAGVDAYFATRSGVPLFLAEQDPLLRTMIAYNFRGSGNLIDLVDDGIGFLQNTQSEEPAQKAGNQDPSLKKAGTHSPFIKSSAIDSSHPLNRYPAGSVAYLDPDRRPGGRRTFSWQDSIPNVIELMPRLCASFDSVWVKSSPMTDPTASMRAWDGHTTDVFAICYQGELKEILFRVQQKMSDDCRIHAVYIYEHASIDPIVTLNERTNRPMLQETDSPPFHVFTRSLHESSVVCIDFSPVEAGDLLFEPHAGLTRLNLSRRFAADMGFAQIAPHVPYFVMHPTPSHPRSDQVPGRIFRIRAVLNYQPKTLASQLKAMGINRAMMGSRGFFLSVAELRSILRIPDGADAYLIFITLSGNRPVCMVADLL